MAVILQQVSFVSPGGVVGQGASRLVSTSPFLEAWILSNRSLLRHPAVHLLICLSVPLVIDVLCLFTFSTLLPRGGTLAFGSSDMLIAISWGGAGLFLCIVMGALLGLPIAGLQIAYLRSRLARLAQGEDPRRALALDPMIAGMAPWLLMTGVAWIAARSWVFPPLGGPLVAVNVLWASALVYPLQWQVHESLLADEELRRAEEPDPELTTLQLTADHC